MFKKSVLPVVTIAMLFASNSLMAQTDAATSIPFMEKNTEMWMLVAMIVTLVSAIVVILALSSFLINSVDDIRKQTLIEKGVLSAEELEDEEDGLTRLWRKLLNMMNDSVPITEEDSVDTGHNYDGIRELDNNLPPWWTMLFYATIIWGVGYLIYYHVTDSGMLQAEEYEYEMEVAEREQLKRLENEAESVDESNVEVLTDASSISGGQRLYNVNCVACHGAFGEGGVGPNLADAYWLHGGGVKNIFKTIKYGVPAKGMISWQQQLKPKQMQEIASYIVTMQGTDPENAKEPQGELWVEESGAEQPVADSTATTEEPTPADSTAIE